jgi:hypothetical protein
MGTAVAKRAPGSLAERFWSIARSSDHADDETSPEPHAVVRHVLRILDALSAGEVGDGLSQSTVSFLQLLRQQESLGDLSYASPEQARGETLDERSLVFSVGVLLFEELTGRHPFGAMASGRRFARIQKCELGSGVQYFPQVPADLRGVLMRAMGPFPEERFRSLAELRAQLERFVDGRADDTPSRPPRKLLRGLAPTPADLVFANVDEAIPTKIHSRLALQQRAVVAPAPAPIVKHGSVRALPLSDEQKASTDKLDAIVTPARHWAILERVAYVACGALLSLVAAYFALRPKAPHAPAVAVAAAPTQPARSLDPPTLAVAAPAPTFDPELAGRNAARAARDCFAPERAARTISFGIGLLFNKDADVARRTFLSPDEPLQPDERRCLARVLTGVSAGAAPAKSSIVELRMRLRPDGHDDVKAVMQK